MDPDHHPLGAPLKQHRLSGAPVLDIQSRCRYSYSQSPSLLSGMAMYHAIAPLFRAKPTKPGEPEGGIAAQSAL